MTKNENTSPRHKSEHGKNNGNELCGIKIKVTIEKGNDYGVISNNQIKFTRLKHIKTNKQKNKEKDGIPEKRSHCN